MEDKYQRFDGLVSGRRFDDAYELIALDPAILREMGTADNLRSSFQRFYEELAFNAPSRANSQRLDSLAILAKMVKADESLTEKLREHSFETGFALGTF